MHKMEKEKETYIHKIKVYINMPIFIVLHLSITSINNFIKYLYNSLFIKLV